MTDDTDLFADFGDLLPSPASQAPPPSKPASELPAPPAPSTPADTPDRADQPSADVVPIDDARARKHTAAKARALVDSSLALAQQAIDSGEADFDDAIKAIGAAHRVLEHTDKMEAQQRAGGATCIVHFTFAPATADSPGSLSFATTEVVDVDATEVQDQPDDPAEEHQAPPPAPPVLTTPVDITNLFASVQR